jgi:hypothetical protein
MYEGVRSPGREVTDSCELTCGYWELNPGPLEEQPVLLTADISPVHLFVYLFIYLFETVCHYVALASQELAV